MNFNLKQVLGDVMETRTVSDPFGLGWTFEVARVSCREHQDYLQNEMIRNPIQKAAVSAVGREQMRRMAAGDSSEIDIEEIQAKAFREAAETFEMDPADILGASDREARSVANTLLRGWNGPTEGADNKPVKFSRKNAYELLTVPELIPEGQYGEGRPFGVVLTKHLMEAAEELEAYNAVVEEAVSGN